MTLRFPLSDTARLITVINKMASPMTDQASFEDRLRRQIEAYHEAALVYAAVTLGLPDRLAGGSATGEELAESLGLSAPHLVRFLRGLCSIGVCEELPDGAFALARGGQSLRPGSPSRLAEKVQIVVGQYWGPWANVVANLKTALPPAGATDDAAALVTELEAATLINPGLAGTSLVFVNGATSEPYLTVPIGGTLSPGRYLVVVVLLLFGHGGHPVL